MRGTIIISLRNRFQMGISKARIFLRNRCYKFESTTDNTGLCIFKSVPIDEYILFIEKESYKDKKMIIQFCDCTLILKITMKEIGYRSIYGKIKDNETNFSISKATVVLYTKNAELIPVDSTKTNEDGEYEIHKIPPGKYLIKAIK